MKSLKHIVRRFILPLLRPLRYLRFWRQLRAYRRMGGKVSSLRPVLGEDTATTRIDPHYFYQGAWAARQIAQARPAEHVDVGSDVDMVGFLTGVTNVTFVDLRPLRVQLPGLTIRQGTVLAMPYADGAVRSLSCLHVAEHVGLGRYGDPLDPSGTRKACSELARVLAPGGTLYFSLPIGHDRTEFNAHRVHRPGTILGYFTGLKLVEFSAIDDNRRYVRNADIKAYDNAVYACGLFRFTKESK